MMKGIIPKSKAKGIDICSKFPYYYIIRSDLGCFMQTMYLNQDTDISICSLHPACQDGDHYIGDSYNYFYVIKGNSYRRVTNLEKDSDAKVFSLHPNCQGGDHYLSTTAIDGSAITNYFYIIFQEKGTYRRTKDLNEDSDGVEYDLHPNCRNGLYYWGTSMPGCISYDQFCFLKPASVWGYEFYRGNDLSNDERTAVYSVHRAILDFLPGGLAVTKGPSFGTWEKIKTIINDSNTPVTWQKRINRKVGYTKQKMTQITHNWKISASVTAETGDLAKLIAKVQFSFSAEYGGSHVSTESESWNEATEEEETFSFELKPNESVYLWQYKLGLGQEPVLFCQDIEVTKNSNPPTKVPLPPAQS